MEHITDIYKYNPQPCVATIGSFDGVHLGHKAMLEELRAYASGAGLPLMAVTFARHPRLLFDGNCEPFLLTSNSQKVALLASAGADIVAELDFDTLMAGMCAERFMKEILRERLGVKLLAIGYDHHFGKPCDGEGFECYAEYGKKLGIEVVKLSPFAVDGIAVSSSVVRRALAAGDLPLAYKALGHSYVLEGTVVHGAGIGRRIGFPTANLLPAEEMMLLPADGVYEVQFRIGSACHKGVMNIGVKPTVDNNRLRTIEVHLLDFSGDIYGKSVSVEFVRRLRGEQHFENIEALCSQIEKDVARVRNGI